MLIRTPSRLSLLTSDLRAHAMPLLPYVVAVAASQIWQPWQHAMGEANASAGAAAAKIAGELADEVAGGACPIHRFGVPDVPGAVLALVSAAGGLLIAPSISNIFSKSYAA